MLVSQHEEEDEVVCTLSDSSESADEVDEEPSRYKKFTQREAKAKCRFVGFIFSNVLIDRDLFVLTNLILFTSKLRETCSPQNMHKKVRSDSIYLLFLTLVGIFVFKS